MIPDNEQLAAAFVGIRESCDLERTDVCFNTDMPLPALELIEDYSGWPDLDELVLLAEQYDLTPGELLDGAIAVARAHGHDLAAERDERDQAKTLLAYLQRHGSIAMYDLEEIGVHNAHGPYNVLFFDGHPVRLVHDEENRITGYELEPTPEGGAR